VIDCADGDGGSGSDVVGRLVFVVIAEVLVELVSVDSCLDWMGSGSFADSVF
jgi:hypothetical protein